ncbi:hypothetical protein Fmac_013083 [Flemingia macrophylla]|uniref:Uncharacterized protein n=1 Tax=Flemingia macrophylla TaxID=520843 RepID=A0ABD1MS52_9FABA
MGCGPVVYDPVYWHQDFSTHLSLHSALDLHLQVANSHFFVLVFYYLFYYYF